MLKLNIKLAWRAFFIFTIIFSICAAVFPAQVKADTVSGLYGWDYRKELTVYGSSADVQTDYQKLIRVYADNTTDVAENIAQYTTGDDGVTSEILTATWRGQSFTAETTGTIKKVWLKIVKVGTPGATYTCAITGIATGVPDETDIKCSGTITGNYISTTEDWYEFDMGAGAALTSGTSYGIILYSAGGSAGNALKWRSDSSGIYTGGTAFTTPDSGANWTAVPAVDYMFQVITSTTGATPLSISCNNHCQTDFDDIRFTRSDGSTLLDYWIENYDTCESDGYADCWVKLDSILQMVSLTEHSHYYLYYGNSSASIPDTDQNMGQNTFLAFDTFNTPTAGSLNTSLWTDISGTWTVASGKAQQTGASGTAKLALTPSGHFFVESYAKFIVNNIDYQSVVIAEASGNDYAVIQGTNAAGTYVDWTYNNPNLANLDTALAEDTAYHTWRIELDNAVQASFLIDNTNRNIVGTNAVPNAPPYYGKIASGTNGGIEWDWIILGKFAHSVPLWGTAGAETTLINPWVIQDVKVFTGYKETDDWLITIRYVNVYPPYYDSYDVKKYFNMQLLDGATAKAVVPMPAWGNKVGNIYLSAAQATALTYGGDYTIRLYSIADSTTYDYDLVATDWWGSDLSQLDSWVITSAAVIGDYYDDLLTTYIAGRGEVLNATGGAIFNAGINGLSTVRPELYQIYTTPINYSPSTTGQAQRISMSNWQVAWGEDGVVMVTRISNWLGVDGGLIGGMFFIIVMFALALLAFPAGHTTAANVLSIPCLGLAVWFGIDLVWLIMLALFAAFLLFKNMFMDK